MFIGDTGQAPAQSVKSIYCALKKLHLHLAVSICFAVVFFIILLQFYVCADVLSCLTMPKIARFLLTYKFSLKRNK